MSVKPAARAHESSRRPAWGSPSLSVGHGVVEREPLVEFRQRREPGERAVVAVAGGDQTGDAAHLAQRPHRVGDVLQDLVGVHDVEFPVLVRQRVHVGHREGDVRRPRRSASARARSSSPGPISVAVTWATRAARSAVMVPGPQPTSSRVASGVRCGSR